MKSPRTALKLAAVLAIAAAFPAQADINIGAVLPLTGATSALGIPSNNGFKLWPAEIAGEKVNVIILDDATDPTTAIRNARRLVTEENVDVLVGSVATPPALAMVDVATETQTPQLALSPVPVPAGKDAWTFRLAHSSTVMANAALAHMAKQGVKTLGFLGYTDAYGETWLKDIQALAEKYGIKVVSTERFQRTDTSVTGQTLKLLAAKPDAILVVASGSGAAMPHRALVERGYKGKIYQTHAAASRDLIRVGGKAVEGAYVLSGPAVIAEQLPDSNPSKLAALDFVQGYEKTFGEGTRNQFAAHVYDIRLLLEQAIPEALKHAKPGTPEFRKALRDALESLPAIPVSQGVVDFTKEDHWGFTPESPVVMKIVNGDWQLETN